MSRNVTRKLLRLCAAVEVKSKLESNLMKTRRFLELFRNNTVIRFMVFIYVDNIFSDKLRNRDMLPWNLVGIAISAPTVQHMRFAVRILSPNFSPRNTSANRNPDEKGSRKGAKAQRKTDRDFRRKMVEPRHRICLVVLGEISVLFGFLMISLRLRAFA